MEVWEEYWVDEGEKGGGNGEEEGREESFLEGELACNASRI